MYIAFNVGAQYHGYHHYDWRLSICTCCGYLFGTQRMYKIFLLLWRKEGKARKGCMSGAYRGKKAEVGEANKQVLQLPLQQRYLLKTAGPEGHFMIYELTENALNDPSV